MSDRQLMDPVARSADRAQARTARAVINPRVPPVDPPPPSTVAAWDTYNTRLTALSDAEVDAERLRGEANADRAALTRARRDAIRAGQSAPATPVDDWDRKIADAEEVVAVHRALVDEARVAVETAYHRAGGRLMKATIGEYVASTDAIRSLVAAIPPALARRREALDQMADVANTYVAPRVPADVVVTPVKGAPAPRDVIGQSLHRILQDVAFVLGGHQPDLPIPKALADWLKTDPPLLDEVTQAALEPFLVDESEPDDAGPRARKGAKVAQDV